MKHANIFGLMLMLAMVQVAPAETIDALLTSGELEARAVVKTPAPHYQKAPIEIIVEVGTPDRFAKGVRVRDFTVPAALVRRMTKTAFNESRRRGGDRWNFQTWRFELHAERTGPVSIAELTTFISVETETYGEVTGEVKLTLPSLEIVAPPGTEGLTSWVAANEFKVEESWEGILDTYQVGDAVTRTRKFTINGSPAMAIPASPEIELNGVQVYQAPPLVDDKEVGGKLEGLREERVVFTFKAGRSHTVPDHRIHWFNVETGKVEQIDLAGRTFKVPDAPALDATPAATLPQEKTNNLWYWALAILGLAFGYWLIRWTRRASWLRILRDRIESTRRKRRARADFMNAAGQQDSRRCLELLYQRVSEHAEWQLSSACSHDAQLSTISAALIAHAYGDGPPPKVSELQRLWQECREPSKPQEAANALRLNPGPKQ